MLMTIGLAIGIMLMFAVMLNIGLIFRNKPLTGTCASKSAVLLENGITCGVCGKEVGTCETELPSTKKNTGN
ncbi:hypothetical protein [Eisenibacter elegans]|uniref:hypothetical protein n=1 Tax=Eisenibacter elegans TaxID=997 RepID=UPI000418B8D0|nr:hypothetical protein [Eisenibacter elegans]